MQDQMTASQALVELTANIAAPETKPYLRSTLQAALHGLDFTASETEAALGAVYKPQTIQ